MMAKEAKALTHRSEMEYILKQIESKAEQRKFEVQIKTVNPFSEYVGVALSAMGYLYEIKTEKQEDDIVYILDINWDVLG